MSREGEGKQFIFQMDHVFWMDMSISKWFIVVEFDLALLSSQITKL